MAPSWRNEVALRSGEMFGDYVPAAFTEYNSPTSLLLLPATDDRLTPQRSTLLNSHLSLANFRCISTRDASCSED